ncbi:MAG: epoxyqueuosine reductase QueH [Anaerolineae bacterium]
MPVAVLDAQGRELSPCPADRAEALVKGGDADWVSQDPPTIRLHRIVVLPEPAPRAAHPLAGRRTLLHICCGPCSTYTVRTMQDAGAILTGYWYNPNVHPFSEHERRRESLAGYAAEIGLPMIWDPGYDMPAYFRAVCGQEQFGMRCNACYRLRLERTARVAAETGFEVFTTTLMISPYQDLAAIRQIGQELATRYGVAFYHENLRRGFSEQHRLAREHSLYLQHYCGCIYSEWEALDPNASTGRRVLQSRRGSRTGSGMPG